MASRGPFGFRARTADKEKGGNTTGLSRQTSITSGSARPSKLPTHSSSFFSRNKQPKPKAEATAAAMHLASNIPIGRGQTSVKIVSTNPGSGSQAKAEPVKSAGLGISMENKTAQVSKSGKTRNVLRRKAPTLDSRSAFARTESSASSYEAPPSRQAMETTSSPEGQSDPFPNQVLGITAPTVSASTVAQPSEALGPSFEYDTSSSRMARFNSRKTPSPSPRPNPALGTSGYMQDSSSSTRASDSPSGLSHSSTPTSMTSHSPGISTPVSIPSVRSNSKPLVQSRPPVAWANKKRQGLEPSSQGLAAVRESGTSSSSSSTVKASGSRDDSSRAVQTSRASPMPLSPTALGPPRQNLRREKTSLEREASVSSRPDSAARNDFPRPSLSTSTVESSGRLVHPDRGLSPPTRPSREGVPSLDMPKFEKDYTVPKSTPFTLGRSLSNISSSSSHHPRLAASPHIKVGRQIEMVNRPPKGEINLSAAHTTKDPSLHSSSPSKSASRFLLFPKRARSPMEPGLVDSTDKASRKGPTAGTGHEGYGKYARRGRSGSMSTSASRGRSTSSTSIGRVPSSRKSSVSSRDEEQMDDFYRSRLQPKKIFGGGQSVTSSANNSEVYLSEAAESSVSTFSRTNPQQGESPASAQEQFDLPPTGASSKTHSLRHVEQRLPHKEGSFDITRGTQLFADKSTPTLATRRSIHRSQLPLGVDSVKIPAPIDTRATAPSPALNSQNTYQSSVAPSDSTAPLTDDISEGREGNWLKSGKREKSAKSPKKWAFFQRAIGSPRKAGPPSSAQPSSRHANNELQAQISQVPAQRNLAFYEMMNPSEHGDDEEANLQLARPEASSQLAPQLPVNAQSPSSELSLDRYKNSVLLPSPPVLTSEFNQRTVQEVPPPPAPTLQRKEDAFVGDQDQSQTQPSVKRPRLQQIGRIPRVVSKRDRPHNPAPQSFSRPRPFVPKSDPSSLPPSSARINATYLPSSIAQKPVLGIQTTTTMVPITDSQLSAKPASAPAAPMERIEGPKTREEFLVFPPRIGSHVSGSSSSGNLSVADITAVVPQPGTAPTEEEEWNEYNDFLDIMESPAPLPKPNVDLHEKAFKAHGCAPAPLDIRKDSSSGSSHMEPTQQVASRVPPPTGKLPSPPKRFGTRTQSPSKENTPVLEARSLSKAKQLEPPRRRSLIASSRYSTSSIESEADSLASLENAPSMRVDVPNHLRLELLTISKQLTFDKVLFSPAHSEILSNKSRVLVLDGLGVDDWAFFCAQEYPEAQISNLSSTPRMSVSVQNYEHHHYPNLEEPFPFPQNYFTAAVLRFPAANSERAYNNVIKEFRRVLSPKGYLEILVLDLDMGKMGNETRRALRGLKERKQIHDPQISLKPLSDTLQKMLGGSSFANLKQCTLEIPVAGLAESTRVRSFNEKMELLDEMPQDKDRTRHLPEIGRWWFSRCYESGRSYGRESRKSIWDDVSVLDECKTMETGFKMVLCHAQKPNNRRTQSF